MAEPRLELLIELITLIVMLISLCGVVIPIFPGLIVIWTLALLYGVITGFGSLGLLLFVLIAALAVMGELADNLLMGRKARQHGAKWFSILFAFIAGIVCSIVFTPLVGIPATLGALFLAEYLARRDVDKSLAVTKDMAIGCGWGFAARFGAGVVMIALWGIWAWAS